ncbi:DUF7282 domain-containing protein [Halobaculum litoreum]|uniref:DUF7282 domain-containing protein n=1 Tax=Halobaculum litoreum TaxID=3031998 RepID=A0ABD5XPD0_9EURY|nr:hypothetical protein [Halobaculum sp. DT92]
MTLPEGGIVTVHDATLLDGDALGSVHSTSAYLAPGTHENATVDPDSGVEADGTFVAMPHTDTDDDDETYDFVERRAAPTARTPPRRAPSSPRT